MGVGDQFFFLPSFSVVSICFDMTRFYLIRGPLTENKVYSINGPTQLVMYVLEFIAYGPQLNANYCSFCLLELNGHYKIEQYPHDHRQKKEFSITFFIINLLAPCISFHIFTHVIM